MLKLAVIVCVCVGLIYSYPGFLEQIPNGHEVPNPCTEDSNDTWSLVGHDFASRAEFMTARRQVAGKYLNVFGEVRHLIFINSSELNFKITKKQIFVLNCYHETKLMIIFRYYTVLYSTTSTTTSTLLYVKL